MEEDGPAALVDDSFDYLLPSHDANLQAWGRAQGDVSDPLPTATQPNSAVFQAGCVMHCGMGGGLYSNVEADGTSMRDALNSWFTSIGTTTAREERRWVASGDYNPANGACWGYSDLWIPLFRSVFLLWAAWAVHLTQVLRRGPDVSMMLHSLARGAANKAGKPDLVPERFGPKQNRAAWLALWLLLFLLCAAGRAV